MAEGLLTPQQQQDIDFNLLKNQPTYDSEDLTDMPDKTGNANKYLTVNATATGYELNDLPFFFGDFYQGVLTFSSSSSSDVNVGFTPKFVVVWAVVADGSSSIKSFGTTYNLDTTPTYAIADNGYTSSAFAETRTDYAWYLQTGTSDYHTGTISLNGTTLTFSNTKNSSPGNAQITYFVIG